MVKLTIKRRGRNEHLFILDGSRFGHSEVFELSMRYYVNIFTLF
jgi:hypothetical protein